MGLLTMGAGYSTKPLHTKGDRVVTPKQGAGIVTGIYTTSFGTHRTYVTLDTGGRVVMADVHLTPESEATP